MVINHNMSAQFANRSTGLTELSTTKNMEKLSSGMKINRAGDDASGLAVSEKMRAQIRGMNQASTNAQNGISFIQTTEGYLQETTDIVQRIRELAVQSSNGIYSDEDRMQIQVEVSQLVAEVDRIASQAQFIGMNMLTGTLDEALKKINKQRADLGAYQNRLEKTVVGLDIGAENLQASESRIRDTDMAKEMVDFTKNQVLTQAGTAMLAQANQSSQNVLSLLR